MRFGTTGIHYWAMTVKIVANRLERLRLSFVGLVVKTNNHMKTLRDEINETIATENIEGVEFVRLNDWQFVMQKFADNFLNQGKQSLERIWLWDSIKEPSKSYQPEKNGLAELESLLTVFQKYWFIVSDEDGKYWVLEATGAAIIETISETRYFEYYITNKDFSWMVCENHHNVMIIKDFRSGL